ncbi:hypothetical protein B296_00013138 [Ensete ventricosum]|uniref:Uncharacterized protein n=1 Tax=Ensete ventricosum TaxID=4639 RepID=A0A427ADX3_ENSVE|nr:hypothetical protein B296_00013138 [Ensete ventricosum]
MVCNSAAVAESAGYSSYKIDAVGGVIGLRQRYKVVVVPGIQQRVTENKHRRNPSSVDRARPLLLNQCGTKDNLVIAPSTKGAKGSCPGAWLGSTGRPRCTTQGTSFSANMIRDHFSQSNIDATRRHARNCSL